MADKKLTKWEAGNVLVRAADQICSELQYLSDYPELQETLKQARKVIADKFNAEFIQEMGFGL